MPVMAHRLTVSESVSSILCPENRITFFLESITDIIQPLICSIHTIAFSEDACQRHEVTDRYLQEIIAGLLDKPLAINQIWNVNFPCCELSACKGVLYNRTVSNAEFYKDCYIETKLSEGRTSYLVEGHRNYHAVEGTDLKAVFENYVSVGIATNIS